jgi:hypothetical protein
MRSRFAARDFHRRSSSELDQRAGHKKERG